MRLINYCDDRNYSGFHILITLFCTFFLFSVYYTSLYFDYYTVSGTQTNDDSFDDLQRHFCSSIEGKYASEV